MAKTIKFNLICDNKPIRTIEDLQNNFSIEDILEYYDNRLLHRWLEVRGYEEELEKVKAITVDDVEDPVEVAKKLIKIFNVLIEDEKIEESVYIIAYLKKRQELYSVYEKENYRIKNIIEDYVNGYNHLVDRILENPKDIAIIKAAISEMTANYEWVLKLNHRDLFYAFRNKHLVLPIMCLLMNEHLRKYYLPLEIKKGEKIIYDTDKDVDKRKMYESICAMMEERAIDRKIGENLRTFAGATNSYWKDLREKGRKYMIIKMEEGDYVRSAGVADEELSASQIKNKFVIIDGIDYKSNSSSHQLMYMEV